MVISSPFMTALGLAFALLFWMPGEKASPVLAPIYPTPQTIVERMLRMAGVQPGERVCDLGSGDGRIVITAAREFHARATGIEIDPKLFEESESEIRKLGLTKTARIIKGDLQKQRYGSYDVVTAYLLSESNDLIEPMLTRELRHGARVVSHDFAFKGWRPTRIDTIDDDGTGKSHVLYLYQR